MEADAATQQCTKDLQNDLLKGHLSGSQSVSWGLAAAGYLRCFRLQPQLTHAVCN